MKQAHFTLLLTFLFSTTLVYTQKVPELTHRKIHVNNGDSLIIAQISLQSKSKHLDQAVNYYWFYNNTIKFNQGDYMGKLLDGPYKVLDSEDNLIEKGSIKQGAKHGTWNTWASNGNIRSTYRWKKGLRNGKYSEHEEDGTHQKGKYKNGNKHGNYKTYVDGHLIEKGKFKHGKLHGKQITYKNDTVFSIKKYKNGTIQIEPTTEIKKEEQKKIPQEKSSKQHWWKFWKKSDEQALSDDQKSLKQKNTRPKKNKQEKKKSTKKKQHD